MNGFRSLNPISASTVDSMVENTPRKGPVQSGTGVKFGTFNVPVVFCQPQPKEARINNESLTAVADDSNAGDNSTSL
jgi:hypothetical protein